MTSKCLFIFIVVHFQLSQALFFGGGSCPTTCQVCSPCSGAGSFAYPNNYGGYPAQYSQPSIGYQSNVGYQSAPSYAIGQQPSASYPVQYSQPSLPSLVSAPAYQSGQQYQQGQPAQTYQPQQIYQSGQPESQPPSDPPPYQDQNIPIVQPTSTAQPEYNENSQAETVTPQQVTPTRGYLDVDVQPVTANTYNGNYGEQVTQVEAATQPYTQTYSQTSAPTTQTTSQSNYGTDDSPDYLQPTGLDDPRKFLNLFNQIINLI